MRRAVALLRGDDARRERLQEHPLRRQILDMITKRPGANITDVCNTVGAGWGTVQHHLYLLGRAGLIRSVVHGRHHRLFHGGEGTQRSSTMALLLRGRVMELVRTILGQPGIGQRQLTDQIGMSRKVLRDYIGLLSEARLIQEVPRSKFRHYYPTPQLRELVADPDIQNLSAAAPAPPVTSEAPR